MKDSNNFPTRELHNLKMYLNWDFFLYQLTCFRQNRGTMVIRDALYRFLLIEFYYLTNIYKNLSQYGISLSCIYMYMYIYIYVCVCVCVCVYLKWTKNLGLRNNDTFHQDFGAPVILYCILSITNIWST